jgi:hypothetical protein
MTFEAYASNPYHGSSVDGSNFVSIPTNMTFEAYASNPYHGTSG